MQAEMQTFEMIYASGLMQNLRPEVYPEEFSQKANYGWKKYNVYYQEGTDEGKATWVHRVIHLKATSIHCVYCFEYAIPIVCIVFYVKNKKYVTLSVCFCANKLHIHTQRKLQVLYSCITLSVENTIIYCYILEAFVYTCWKLVCLTLCCFILFKVVQLITTCTLPERKMLIEK